MNKKIEEMARYMCLDCAKDSYCSLAQVGGMCNSVRKQAAAIYEAGYRKQTEGEWLTDRFGLERSICSVCGAVYEGDGGNYCSNCGAKMKGGE